MVIGTLRIPLAATRRLEVLEVLRSIQGRVLAQPGCAACDIYEEQGADQAVVLFERWESDATFEAHVRSDDYRRILSAIELSGSPPQVRFEHVSSSEGLELIERLRSLEGISGTPGRGAPGEAVGAQPPASSETDQRKQSK